MIGYRFGLFLFSFFRKSAIEWESASTVGFILLFQFASRFLKNYNFVSATRSAKKSRMCFSYSTLYIHSCTSILEEFFLSVRFDSPPVCVRLIFLLVFLSNSRFDDEFSHSSFCFRKKKQTKVFTLTNK